ncbi:14126_t:CDS:2 [Rhizophagus irregularis]|nr:14126_t:CDS:2 [Rhizophagus irregularis]
MFQDTTAWFSSSVDRTYVDLWRKNGGRIEDKYKDDKLPEYLFSIDPEEHDTQRLIRHISYIVIHPEWIFDTIIDKKRKPIDKYLLLNYDFQDTNIASAVRNNKSSKRISSNGLDILDDLANHNQVNNDFIIAHSPSIPNKKYYLPRKRSRKVSKGKNPVQYNNIQQSITMDSMNIHTKDASQIDSISSDLQSDTQTEGSAINNPDEGLREGLRGKPKRDRPRTLPNFMSNKRSNVVLTSASEDDSFFSDEDSSKKRKRTNYTQKTPPTGKKTPSSRCECGRPVQPTITAKQPPKDPPQNVNKESKSITSIRLQHISIRSLLEKVLKYLRVVKGSNSSLMDDVYEFTPGRNGFSARTKSTACSRATSANPRVQTRGKSLVT